MKYCEDCENCMLSENYDTPEMQLRYAKCRLFPEQPKPNELAVLSRKYDLEKEPAYRYCTVQRTAAGKCGPEAKLFAPLPQKEIKAV